MLLKQEQPWAARTAAPAPQPQDAPAPAQGQAMTTATATAVPRCVSLRAPTVQKHLTWRSVDDGRCSWHSGNVTVFLAHTSTQTVIPSVHTLTPPAHQDASWRSLTAWISQWKHRPNPLQVLSWPASVTGAQPVLRVSPAAVADAHGVWYSSGATAYRRGSLRACLWNSTFRTAKLELTYMPAQLSN